MATIIYGGVTLLYGLMVAFMLVLMSIAGLSNSEIAQALHSMTDIFILNNYLLILCLCLCFDFVFFTSIVFYGKITKRI